MLENLHFYLIIFLHFYISTNSSINSCSSSVRLSFALNEPLVLYCLIQLLKADGVEIDRLTTLSNPIALTIVLPTELQEVAEGYTRTYYVVRVHDGKAELLETTLSEDGKSLTFETDKFSTYALTYVDSLASEETPTTPETPEVPQTFDSLFTYVQNFEEWIEKEQLNRHEYKNQLAILRCLTTEKKVKDKIDEILEDSINIEGEVVHQLKALPKGGVKGLMYYKATIAQKNKINLTVNVSLETKSILTRLSEKDIRILCKLIGIYFDNAIEAAKETRKKIVLIEIYELSDRVNMVFSNTFKKHDNFKDRNQKGVSSKGEGHGNGLYFAKKLIEANSWLEQKQEVIDKYYIQQISIKKKNTDSIAEISAQNTGNCCNRCNFPCLLRCCQNGFS